MPFHKVLSAEHLELSKNTHNSSLSSQISRGFTLIELLVVLGILVTAVGASLLFLTTVLKGTNQANVTAEVKQNGQAVLDSLEKQIRGATNASDGSGKYIKLTREGINPLHIKCFLDGLPPKSANGWIGTVVSTDDPPSDLSYIPTTNQNSVSGVDVTDCNFTVLSASTGSPSVVSMSFVVNQGIDAPSRADFLANVKFETTISLRQY